MQIAAVETGQRGAMLDRFRAVRAATLHLAAPLSAEDCQMQSMPDASPTKWHLAHTTWFFETFLLLPHLSDYEALNPAYTKLFNSYYVGVGDRHARPQRGLISRPSLEQVIAYRAHVDAAMERLLRADDRRHDDLVELGLQHEQQHQELILMDIQHAFSCNSVDPLYAADWTDGQIVNGDPKWVQIPGGLYRIGHQSDGFSFDNEGKAHRLWLEPFSLFRQLVPAGDYTAFIDDRGYARPELWLSDGWAMAQNEGWTAPLYWQRAENGWSRFSLAGRRAISPDEPLVHISYYEAEAYARWASCRLPTEAEWEVAANQSALDQIFDTAWQWTGSAYLPYAGFVQADGAVGEYNGKFMINQMVLRGGSCATPAGHSRASYRNFFPPGARWAFSGLRLARSDGAPD
jgi:ergothioneine biosynthesis protein EgtB